MVEDCLEDTELAQRPASHGTRTQFFRQKSPKSSPRQMSLQDAIEALEAEKYRKSQMKTHRSVSFLKTCFAKSMLSRSDLSSAYAPGSHDLSAQLRDRAVAARSTMKAWCDLVNMDVPAVATTPLPQQLTEMHVSLACLPQLFEHLFDRSAYVYLT